MQIPGFYLPKRIQVEYHLRRWKMWMILESRLAHKGILSSAWKARQALEILTKFALCANYSILENQPVGFRARMNMRNFPDGPVAKTLLPMQRARGSIPGQGTRCHMPQLKTRVPHWDQRPCVPQLRPSTAPPKKGMNIRCGNPSPLPLGEGFSVRPPSRATRWVMTG